MKENYIDNINSLLSDGLIENIELRNIDILHSILFDDNIGVSLYKGFENNFYADSIDYEDLYSKTEDMIYRLHLLVNEYLIKEHNIQDETSIKKVVNDLIDKGADFYSSVSFDENDNEIIEDYDLLYNELGVPI